MPATACSRTFLTVLTRLMDPTDVFHHFLLDPNIDSIVKAIYISFLGPSHVGTLTDQALFRNTSGSQAPPPVPPWGLRRARTSHDSASAVSSHSTRLGWAGCAAERIAHGLRTPATTIVALQAIRSRGKLSEKPNSVKYVAGRTRRSCSTLGTRDSARSLLTLRNP